MSKDSYFNASITNIINSAKEAKQGIYSDEPQITSQQLAQDVKAAEEDFSQVVDGELRKIKVFADEENARILEMRRQNEAEVACPICLEDVPAIGPDDVVIGVLMECCGIYCHRRCYAKWMIRRQLDPTMSGACFHCRKIKSDTSNRITSWEEMSLTGSSGSKANALFQIGDAYENGTSGKERNLEEAIKYYEKAAELGNDAAQTTIAIMCESGKFHELSVPESPEKAMEMTKRAVDQGNPIAQVTLAIFLSQHDSHMDTATEVHRLLALSAYQGDIEGIMELETYYYQKWVEKRDGKGRKSNQESRENLLLTLYWAGRVCKKENELSPEAVFNYKVKFVSLLEIATSMFWHVRPCFELDPLTGYSHIPFIASIHSMASRTRFHYQVWDDCIIAIDIWKHICANCGKQGDKECDLKQCARCKVFSYCSKECQVKHWKAGHKADCKGRHWIESYFRNIRTASQK
jgi:hypothetical protein